MSGEPGQAAAQVISDHERSADGGCICSWHDDTVAHAAHVVHELQLAGLDVVWR